MGNGKIKKLVNNMRKKYHLEIGNEIIEANSIDYTLKCGKKQKSYDDIIQSKPKQEEMSLLQKHF